MHEQGRRHEQAEESPREGKEPCLECEHERQLSKLRATHTEEEIHTLRIEQIQTQILRKLRLEAPPNVTSRPTQTIPAPLREIYEREEAMALEEPGADINMEEFYGRKTEIIVFGTRIENCEDDDGNLAACFHFELKNKLSVEEMDSAELFIYKSREHGRHPPSRRTLKVHNLRHRARDLSEVLASKRIVDKRGKWVNFDMKHPARRWLQHPERNRGVQISCDGCRLDEHEFPIHAGGEKKPFLVIHTRDVKNRQRKKRSANCPRDGCCMESFYVSFRELGWDSWIIEPAGYYSNYCKGNCRMMPSINRNRPNSMLVHILQKASAVRNAPDLLPCCAPTRMSPRSILYYNSSGQVEIDVLPNMVVESCGCS